MGILLTRFAEEAVACPLRLAVTAVVTFTAITVRLVASLVTFAAVRDGDLRRDEYRM